MPASRAGRFPLEFRRSTPLRMRQIGSISEEFDARRFAAHLVTIGIQAHVEQDGDAWAVWVKDENLIESAAEELEQFRLDPKASRYQRAFQQAEDIHRNEQQRREKARKNVVEMRGRWKSGLPVGGTPRRAPLVFVLIGISVVVSLLTGLGEERSGTMQQLLFSQPDVAQNVPVFPDNGFEQILQGQIWRLITPIFIHFGLLHIIFNMLVLYVFGSQIEDRRGTARFGLFVLLIAVISNVGQYLYGEHVAHSPTPTFFGGMSGVNYGLFGYIWIKSRFEPALGLRVSTFNVLIMFAWLFLGIFREAGATSLSFMPEHMGNAAHGIGFLVGVIVAYAPLVRAPSHEK